MCTHRVGERVSYQSTRINGDPHTKMRNTVESCWDSGFAACGHPKEMPVYLEFRAGNRSSVQSSHRLVNSQKLARLTKGSVESQKRNGQEVEDEK